MGVGLGHLHTYTLLNIKEEEDFRIWHVLSHRTTLEEIEREIAYPKTKYEMPSFFSFFLRVIN